MTALLLALTLTLGLVIGFVLGAAFVARNMAEIARKATESNRAVRSEFKS